MQLEHGNPMSHDPFVLVILGKLEVRMEWYLFVVICCYAIMKSGGNDKWILIATRNCMVSTGMRIHCD